VGPAVVIAQCRAGNPADQQADRHRAYLGQHAAGQQDVEEGIDARQEVGHASVMR
jgi:hypothetical protein